MSFIHRTHYPLGKSRRNPPNMTLGGSKSGKGGIKLLPLPGIELDHRLVTKPNELRRLTASLCIHSKQSINPHTPLTSINSYHILQCCFTSAFKLQVVRFERWLRRWTERLWSCGLQADRMKSCNEALWQRLGNCTSTILQVHLAPGRGVECVCLFLFGATAPGF